MSPRSPSPCRSRAASSSASRPACRRARSISTARSRKPRAAATAAARSGVRNALVVAELSLAVVLLVGAGLMIRSVRNLAALDPGFDPGSVLTLRVSVPRAPAPPAAGTPARRTPAPEPVVRGRALLERMRAVPGVGGGGARHRPAARRQRLGGHSTPPKACRRPRPQNVPRAYTHRISPEFFSTLRIPIVAGRTFTEAELTPASLAVVVSERVVKRFWPGQDPIGKRIKFGQLTSSAGSWLSIVGVVGEVKYRGLPDNPTAIRTSTCRSSTATRSIAIAVRTTRAALVAGRAAARRHPQRRSVDSDLPGRDDGRADRQPDVAVALHDVADGRVRRRRAVAVGDRHLRRDVVSGDAADARDRHPARARRRRPRHPAAGRRQRRAADCRRASSSALAASFALQRLVASLLFGVTAADAASARRGRRCSRRSRWSRATCRRCARRASIRCTRLRYE